MSAGVVKLLEREGNDDVAGAGMAPMVDRHGAAHLLGRLFEAAAALQIEIVRAQADPAELARLRDAHAKIVRTAASLPARSMQDVLFKMAIWRWDEATLARPLESFQPGEAVAYSVFCDLVQFTGERGVLSDVDTGDNPFSCIAFGRDC